MGLALGPVWDREGDQEGAQVEDQGRGLEVPNAVEVEAWAVVAEGVPMPSPIRPIPTDSCCSSRRQARRLHQN